MRRLELASKSSESFMDRRSTRGAFIDDRNTHRLIVQCSHAALQYGFGVDADDVRKVRLVCHRSRESAWSRLSNCVHTVPYFLGAFLGAPIKIGAFEHSKNNGIDVLFESHPLRRTLVTRSCQSEVGPVSPIAPSHPLPSRIHNRRNQKFRLCSF